MGSFISIMSYWAEQLEELSDYAKSLEKRIEQLEKRLDSKDENIAETIDALTDEPSISEGTKKLLSQIKI